MNEHEKQQLIETLLTKATDTTPKTLPNGRTMSQADMVDAIITNVIFITQAGKMSSYITLDDIKQDLYELMMNKPQYFSNLKYFNANIKQYALQLIRKELTRVQRFKMSSMDDLEHTKSLRSTSNIEDLPIIRIDIKKALSKEEYRIWDMLTQGYTQREIFAMGYNQRQVTSLKAKILKYVTI